MLPFRREKSLNVGVFQRLWRLFLSEQLLWKWIHWLNKINANLASFWRNFGKFFLKILFGNTGLELMEFIYSFMCEIYPFLIAYTVNIVESESLICKPCSTLSAACINSIAICMHAFRGTSLSMYCDYSTKSFNDLTRDFWTNVTPRGFTSL